MSLLLVAMLVLAAALFGVGCWKPDPIIAEYSSVGAGRSDGGWTLTLYASGKWNMKGQTKGAGTYASDSTGYQLQVVLPPGSLPKLARAVVHGFDTGCTALITVKTNGTEYLLDRANYDIFRSTSDTNALRYELKRVR